jgi:glycosyltransferase involved in cell wall biosynthesis
MPEALVSVIIPTYNRAEMVCAAVDSVLKQTYPNIELIVVDDGSTDDTTDALMRYGSRLRLIHQDNSGPAAARNRGAEIADGDIIAFLDSDDLWLPDKIEKQLKALEHYGDSVPCCLCNAFLESQTQPKTTSFDLAPLKVSSEQGLFTNVTGVLVTRSVLFNQAAAIRRWAWEQVGGFDESLTYMEDHDLAVRLSLLGPWAVIREPLVVYRRGNRDALSTRSHMERTKLLEDMISFYTRIVSTGQITDRKILRQIENNLRRVRYRLRLMRPNGDKGLSLWLCRAQLSWEEFKLKLNRRSPWFAQLQEKKMKSQYTECIS